MANSLQSTENEQHALTALASLSYRYMVRTAALSWMKARSVLRAPQTSRMLLVLANLSDRHLAVRHSTLFRAFNVRAITAHVSSSFEEYFGCKHPRYDKGNAGLRSSQS